MKNVEAGKRIVPAQVLTTAGWMTMDFLVLERGYFHDLMESVPEFYTVRNASMIGIETTAEYFALQRDALVLVVPDEDDGRLEAERRNTRTERVFVLLDSGIVEGDLEIQENIPLSHYVTRQDGLLLLRNCTLHLGALFDEQKAVRQFPVVIANVNRIVGISTSEPV